MKAIANIALATGLGLLPFAAAAADEGAALAAKYSCSSCHAVSTKLVGPAFKDVAKKYAGDASAAATLAGKVKNGSVGTWGQIPMPPNNVPDADLKKLIAWVLSA